MRLTRLTRQYAGGFSVFYVLGVFVVLGVIVLAGMLAYNAQQPKTNGGLVAIPGPKTTPSSLPPEEPADGPPKGFVAYSNPRIGFSLAYPEAWGDLQPVADEPVELKLATNKIATYSVTDALEIRADKTDKFRLLASSKGVMVAPSPSGGEYVWKVAAKGTDKQLIGKIFNPVPQVVYRSGKTIVYGFSITQDACTHVIWAFAAQDNFVGLRLPSFCISNKPADADVQATQKVDFDNQKSQILQSITVH